MATNPPAISESNTFNSAAEIIVEQGSVIIPQPNGSVTVVTDTYPLQDIATVVFADSNAKYMVMRDGEPILLNWPCPTCVLIAPQPDSRVDPAWSGDVVDTAEMIEKGKPVSDTDIQSQALSAQELADLQSFILAGGDPTELLEAPAAGIEAGTGLAGDAANSGFVIILYDGDAILTEAGFETRYERDESEESDDSTPLFVPEGGETGSMQLTEGDLQPNTYPSESSVMVSVAAGTLPLDAASFTFDLVTLSQLIAELDSQITSGGQPVSFSFNITTNAIIGTLVGTSDGIGDGVAGNTVVTFQLNADSTGREVALTVTTLLERPIDHIEDGSGLVTFGNDSLTVVLAIQGNDLAGNSLDNPVLISSTIVDGLAPQFGTDPGTVIDEADALGEDAGETVAGAVPIDLGSDTIRSVIFDAQQPGLDGLTSNGFATTVITNGDQLQLVDSRGELVLALKIETDGSYTANLTQPLDQLTRAQLVLDVAVTATDFDGDTAAGQVVLITIDGNSPPGGETGEITITEPDLVPNEYPITAQTNVDITAGIDRLDPNTVSIDQQQLATLIAELNTDVRSGGQPLTFSYDQATGILSGSLVSGAIAVTLTVTAAQGANGQDLVVTVVLEQRLPLDHVSASNSSGLVAVNGEKLVISLPIQANDSDGDFLDAPAVVTVTINDGPLPTFGADSGASLVDPDNVTTGQTTTATGQIVVDVGSDAIASLVFVDNPALSTVIAGFSSNGEAVSYQVSQNQLTIMNTTGEVILTVNIATDGNYSVVMSDAFDQPVSSNQIQLPINVRATDDDGDAVQSSITISLNDGVDPPGGETVAAALVEPDLNPSNYPETVTATLTMVAGADRILPDSLTIDPAQINALIAAWQTALTSAGQPLVFTFIPATNPAALNAITGVLEGRLPDNTLAVSVTLSAAQASNGDDIVVTMVTSQFVPLDHIVSVSSPYIAVNSDEMVLNVPLIATDSDGDNVIQPATFTVVISDGVDPVIEATPPLQVKESDIDAGGDFHPGSTPSGQGQTATGQITFDTGSDAIKVFEVDVDAFNTANAGNLTAGGQAVTLVFNAASDRYEGQVNGTPVFLLVLTPTGSVTFTLLGALDHVQPANDTQLELTFVVTADDQDGDTSNAANLVVTVEDDIPQIQAIAFRPVEEGNRTETRDILTVSQEGADDADVTAVIIAGMRQELTGTPNGQGFFSFDVSQDGQLLGQLLINPNGRVFFNALPNVDHTGQPIVTSVEVEVTDGDDDTSQNTVTITITDEGPELTVQPANGVEDQGRNADETLGDPTQGIAIDMSIDIGDGDRNEQIGEVFIVLPAEPHGLFYLNGVELIPTAGQILLPASAFTDPDGDEIFTLQGVTFVPDADYSTFAEPGNEIDFTVTAQVVTDDGVNHPLQSGTLTIDILGIADPPVFAPSTVTYYGNGIEDGANISLTESFQAVLQDNDGSEVLTYFITITEGEGEIVGSDITQVSPGVFEVPVSAIGLIALNPADNFSGDIRLNVTAQSREVSHFAPGFETAQITEAILVNVLPVADEAQLKVSRINSLEDQPIALAPLITLTELDDTADDFGVETLFVRISALPTGAQLEQNGTVLVPNADGVVEILYSALDQVQLIPVPESNVDFQITVVGVVKDVVTITEADGTTKQVEDVSVTPAQFIDIGLTGVADVPGFDLDGTNWTDIVGGTVPGIETTIDEDTSAVLDFNLVSGERVNAPLDDSETLTFVISNIPQGTRIFDAQGNEQTLVFVGFDPTTGLPRYEVKLTGEAIGEPGKPVEISIKPPENSTQDITLNASVVVTENDGDHRVSEFELVIHIVPIIDGADYSRQSNGLEDEFNSLNWQPVLADTKEEITGLVLGNLQPGYQLQINNGGTITPLVIDAAGSVTLDTVQLGQLLAGAQLQLLAPPNSDLNLTGATAISTQVTVTETDVDSPATDTKVINGTLNVVLRAVVEPNAELGVQVTNAQGQPEFVDSIVSGDGSLDLSGGAGSDGQIVFEDLDPSSDEVILTLVITFPDPNIQFVVVGGVNNGDGSWTIPSSSLNAVQILAPEGFTGTVAVQLAAQVQDQSDDGDPSAIVEVTSTLTIDFQGSTLNLELAADIAVDQTIIVTGNEDSAVDLASFLNQIVTIDTSAADQPNDEFSLVISAASLPSGASISGTEFNFVTNEYVIKLPVPADGNLNLSGITLNLPQDFAGDFLLDVKYVNTDTASGNVKEVTDSIPVRISPIVDVPSRMGDNLREPDIAVSVVETQGLDADRQPIAAGDPEVIYPGIAYEDGTIVLDITATVADISTTTLEGLETIQQATVTTGALGGFFLNAAGEQVTSLTITDVSQLSSVRYIPPKDFNGEISLTVDVTIVDTANYDQTSGAAVQTDTADFSGAITFEVIAVNDTLDFTGTETPVVGNEDSGPIRFTGIGGEVVDVDGSEAILSVKIVNVPDGFIIDGAANNGGGEWSISVPTGSTAFDLAAIGLTPPKNFSGTIELGIVVFTKETSLELPEENTATFMVDVKPIADKVDTDITTTVSGREDQDVTLTLNITVQDDSDSFTGTASNVTENPPETLQVQISNVPESSQIALPSGVTGTASNLGGGVWVVIVPATELASLTFIPGNANSNNWNGQLDLAIRAVDQTDVALDSNATFQTITLTIEAVDDAPVLPDIANQTVAEDTALVINDLSVTDVDFNETGTTGVMTVTLSAANGTLTVSDPGGGTGAGSVTITGNGSGTVTLAGGLADINTLFAAGVTYQGDPNFSGEDTITVTADDNGNVGAGGPLQATTTINITVIPTADLPTLELSIPQLTNTRAALGVLVPLIGLVAAVADASETLLVEVRNLGPGRLVNAAGTEVGTNNGGGSWQVPVAQLDDLFIADLPQGLNNLTIVAISQESDGSQAESTEVLIGIRMDNLTETGNQIGVGESDGENFVLGSAANEQLFGGLADDILVGGGGEDTLFGGAGSDELWGGERNGTGDGVRDVFTWQTADLGAEGTPFTDTVKDMEIGIDQLNIAEILPDALPGSLPDNGEDESDLDRLLNNITATVEDSDTIQLDIAASATQQQNIVLDNIDVVGLGLDSGSSSAEIINQLFTNNTFIVD
ncbi:retention module-containing protein [Photobacterium nomapromontoriensis]|uniref:retention module-containing protein n=1 Tax=Photobacterium nomapromontoriensis TaxID=2910237 RepID=UPI003D097157